jgi:hypothetical protein
MESGDNGIRGQVNYFIFHLSENPVWPPHQNQSAKPFLDYLIWIHEKVIGAALCPIEKTTHNRNDGKQYHPPRKAVLMK